MYRVNYDEHNWEMIASALSQDFNNIHYLNRAQVTSLLSCEAFLTIAEQFFGTTNS